MLDTWRAAILFFVRQLKAEPIEYHAHHDLLAVIAFLFVCAPFGLRITGAKPLEVSIGQIVKEYRAIKAKQLRPALHPFVLQALPAPPYRARGIHTSMYDKPRFAHA